MYHVQVASEAKDRDDGLGAPNFIQEKMQLTRPEAEKIAGIF